LSNDVLLWIAAGGAVLACLIALLAWLSRPARDDRLDALLEGLERTERALRADMAESQRGLRAEFAESTRGLRQELAQSHGDLRAALTRDAQAARAESAESLARFAAGFGDQLQGLIQINERRLMEVRTTVDQRLQALQNDNSAKLDDMRRTVDEKLHATLEQRLGESFKQVSDRLEAVHKGLGEMQALAAGVGDLKRVLTNVKSRGTWAEYQLEALLQDILTPEQYGKNVATRPDGDERVEFAVRLPGRSGESTNCVWLPIDSKFPQEPYARLICAFETGDPEEIRVALAALAQAVRVQAYAIHQKYVAPPYTTDIAVMFLPTEGLYAEVLRIPGLAAELQNHARVMVAGPTTLAALLSSLRVGFQTLAIEKRATEVWNVLRAVKTEFGKFGGVLGKLRKQLERATRTIDFADQRSRAMERRLREVEALPDRDAMELLHLPEGEEQFDDELMSEAR
jgi:DNA recombination protein RmuC